MILIKTTPPQRHEDEFEAPERISWTCVALPTQPEVE